MSYFAIHEGLSNEDLTEHKPVFQFKQQADMNKLVMNYLVTEGFKDAAEIFQKEAGVELGSGIGSLDDRTKIREAVQNGRIEEATNMVHLLYPRLLENEKLVHIHLQQLRLIEFIRAGKVEEALAFAQSQFSEVAENNTEVLKELERILMLLAYEKPQNSPTSHLLEISHRRKIASELNAAILKVEHLEYPCPKIAFLLKMILWAQSELDNLNFNYPKMQDLATASIHMK